MNILIITPDVYPFQKGYGGRNPINLFETFSRMGNATSLLASVPDREWYGTDQGRLNGLFEIVMLHSIEFVPRDFDYFSLPYVRDLLKIRRVLHKKQYDIIILNDYFWSLSLLSLLLMGKKSRSRTLMINHGLVSPPGLLLKYLFKAFSSVISRVFIPQFIGILSYSRRSHNAISKFVNSQDRLYIHPLCIDTLQFIKDFEESLLLPEEYFEKKFGITGRFIIAIGAASPHKGYENLIRAFFKICGEYSNIELVIAGQFTPYSETLRNLTDRLNISGRIKFIGSVSDVEKFHLLRKCSIFVVPSLSEGFGAGAMEADVLQVKVVATDTGAHKDILGNNKFARIVSPGDETHLFTGMKDLLSMEEDPTRTLDMDKLHYYSCESLASFILSIANQK